MTDSSHFEPLRAGIRAAKAGNLLLARPDLTRAAELAPHDPNCWIWLAWIAENPESAVLYLERAAACDPHHRIATVGLQWAKAMAEFDLDANNATAQYQGATGFGEQDVLTADDFAAASDQASNDFSAHVAPSGFESGADQEFETASNDFPSNVTSDEPSPAPSTPFATDDSEEWGDFAPTPDVTPASSEQTVTSMPSDGSFGEFENEFPVDPADDESSVQQDEDESADDDFSFSTAVEQNFASTMPSVDEDEFPSNVQDDFAAFNSPEPPTAPNELESEISVDGEDFPVDNEFAPSPDHVQPELPVADTPDPNHPTSALGSLGERLADSATAEWLRQHAPGFDTPSDGTDAPERDGTDADPESSESDPATDSVVEPQSESPESVDSEFNAAPVDAPLHQLDEIQSAPSDSSALDPELDGPVSETESKPDASDQLADEAPLELSEIELSDATSDDEQELVEQVSEMQAEVNESLESDAPLESDASPNENLVEESPEKEENSRKPSTQEFEDLPRVLVVDDSPTVRKLVTMTLQNEALHIDEAANGHEALKVMANSRPDLVLCDINMPKLDGYKLCKIIKKHPSTKHIVVVMLSGKDGMFDKLRGQFAGCDDYITKPFESSALIEKVWSFLKTAARS